MPRYDVGLGDDYSFEIIEVPDEKVNTFRGFHATRHDALVSALAYLNDRRYSLMPNIARAKRMLRQEEKRMAKREGTDNA